LDLAPNQISSQHHGVLDNLNNIYDKLRSTDLYVELKLAKNFDETILKLEEANKQLKVFKPEAFTKASNLVDDLINKKVSFEDQTIKQNLGTFLNRAVEHKIYQKENFWTFKFAGQRGWLFCAVLMASIVVTIVYSFIKVIESDGGNISLGEAVLRISSLIIPSYFMIFFLNQFNYHKRMYEIYSFKNTSLNIMGDLMRTNTDKSDDILKRGLDVLFSEPDPNLSKKYDKQLITDLVGIAKSQLNK
jgi:hypothetical protein